MPVILVYSTVEKGREDILGHLTIKNKEPELEQ
jgi:hypothetical protein